MRTLVIIASSLIVACSCINYCAGHVYVVIYATIDGRTGHAGIAIDNYDIITSTIEEDTVANGTLTYFDLWPSKDDFGLFSYSKDQKAMYYKLPNAIWSESVTLTRLYYEGIPHREHYPPDAILKLKTTPFQDFALAGHLTRVIDEKAIFNPRYYNCTDFVNEALAFITGSRLRVKEFIPFSYTSTPNKLCRKLMRLAHTIVIKSPGDRVSGSFMRERVLQKNKNKNESVFADSR